MVCENPTFDDAAGEHTRINLCRNDNDETTHDLCFKCYNRLSLPKRCPMCRESLNPYDEEETPISNNTVCDKCDSDMGWAGKHLSLKCPPESVVQKYGVIVPAFEERQNGTMFMYSRVCFACIFSDFMRESYDAMPERLGTCCHHPQDT